MHQTIRNATLSIALLSIAAGAACIAQPARAQPASKSMSRAVALPDLPPGLIVPDQLPRAIRDPQLLTAWIELYNHTEPIALWDGRALTGRDLAQFVLDHGIPVVWDVAGLCGGSSCSVLTCNAAGCTYTDEASGVDPLYIRPTLQGDAVGTLNALAHEVFHRTQPFGAVADTKFEEYWAYRVGNSIAPKAWPVFDGYDPLVSGWLFLWLRDNNMGAYYRLADYPPIIDQFLASAERPTPQPRTPRLTLLPLPRGERRATGEEAGGDSLRPAQRGGGRPPLAPALSVTSVYRPAHTPTSARAQTLCYNSPYDPDSTRAPARQASRRVTRLKEGGRHDHEQR